MSAGPTQAVSEPATGAAVDAGLTPAVALIGLRRAYGPVLAVDRVDLEIADGEFFSMIGPSGCGKTTTLRMIAGLVDPSEGRIEVRGRDITRVRAYKRPVNTVFQQYALFPHMTVFENVAFGLRERRVGRAEIATRVAEMLELVGLTGRERAKPAQLSGGQQQRVALARSLVLRPEVLLLDEPLGALDLKMRKQLQMQLKRVQHEVGITFVYVTHDQEEAFSMSDRVAIMQHGLIQQLGTPQDVYQRPVNEFVADFVGASNRRYGEVTGTSAAGYEVDLAGIGRVPAAGVAGMRPGQRVCALVRPESVELAPSASGWTTVSACVVDLSYLGPQVTCVLETPGDEQVTMSLRSGMIGALAVGDTCEIGWPHTALWALPADPQAEDAPAADAGAAPE
ncbi:MAG: ABC transporter ATP-binding protein [Solirubrobacteraceae bacterium]